MDLTLHTLVIEVEEVDAREEMRGRSESSCSSLFARSWKRAAREFRRCRMLNAAIGELGLTSIEMLNVARRWNKESRFYFPICSRRAN